MFPTHLYEVYIRFCVYGLLIDMLGEERGEITLETGQTLTKGSLAVPVITGTLQYGIHSCH